MASPRVPSGWNDDVIRHQEIIMKYPNEMNMRNEVQFFLGRKSKIHLWVCARLCLSRQLRDTLLTIYNKKWFDIVNVIFKVTHSTKGFHTWICHMGWGGDLGSYEDCLTSSIFSSDESLLPLNCAMGTKCFLVLKEPFGTIESHPQAVRN